MATTSFTLDQKKLLSVLSSMQPICTKRTTLDATPSIFISNWAQRVSVKKN